ncbi:hypothetical protein AGOR_G00032670 [Albula goreensis]|uniref:RING-type domain-containing protein n=1 Tax=Albula goreensis TaxID=1534307 RepID=A0A8T3E303_9TELE|nr:hypothetical protein AGOR_G00032670 [Albula goreensis]
MKAAKSSPHLDEYPSCPVCDDSLLDPIALRCGHSFCKACLQQYWELSRSLECLVCRRTDSSCVLLRRMESPPVLSHLAGTSSKREKRVRKAANDSKNEVWRSERQIKILLEKLPCGNESARRVKMEEDKHKGEGVTQISMKMKVKTELVEEEICPFSCDGVTVKQEIKTEDASVLQSAKSLQRSYPRQSEGGVCTGPSLRNLVPASALPPQKMQSTGPTLPQRDTPFIQTPPLSQKQKFTIGRSTCSNVQYCVRR